MSNPKLRGYMYEIVELFPLGHENGDGLRNVTTHDRLEDAEKVLAVLESVNYNFTCYGIMLRPVWESVSKNPIVGFDANGSPVYEDTDMDGRC
jgi:hypothetical protein